VISKKSLPVIESERLCLRPLTAADLPMTLSWRNQDAIRKWFFHSEIIRPEQHRVWFESYQEKDNDFVFVIEERIVLQRPVGQVSLYNIDWDKKRAEFGRLMIGDPEACGLGLAKEATRILIEFAERELGLQEVYLEVYADNLPAVAVYCACGFSVTEVKEGVLHMRRNWSCPEKVDTQIRVKYTEGEEQDH